MTITPPVLVASVLALATVLSVWRSYRRHRNAVAVAVWAQPLLALLFYGLLFPPSVPASGDTLTVLTAGATPAQRRALPLLQSVVALPEADAAKTVERVPDLATALRRYPQTKTLAVVGNGLPPRDQDVARMLALRFDAAPEQGLVELSTPSRAAQGTQWSLAGRALAPVVRVELHDPSGAMIDGTAPAREGRFRLSALARAAGTARYELRLLDAKQAVIDTVSLPLTITPGERLSVIIRAGAPDPEFKYWRRWAADAGIATRATAGLSEGVSLRDGDTQLTPAALAAADLVIVDERAWSTLGADEKSALRSAIDAGLGLLLRAGGPVEPTVAADWAALGFRTSNVEAPGSVTIDRRSGLHDRTAFTRAPVSAEADDATALLEADDGEALALWRNEGRGRIGFWRLVDSYRLTLIGEPARYGSLWQSTLAALTRAKPAETSPELPDAAWVGERSALCRLGDAATVQAPDGSTAQLIVDAHTCAAYWPAVAGWHRLQTGGAAFPFHVRAADDARYLRTARDRAATQALVHAVAIEAPETRRDATLPRWPFFLAWLLATAGLWWRERPR